MPDQNQTEKIIKLLQKIDPTKTEVELEKTANQLLELGAFFVKRKIKKYSEQQTIEPP